jgi:hypothetical protein
MMVMLKAPLAQNSAKTPCVAVVGEAIRDFGTCVINSE